MTRADITFTSGGLRCAAWLYLPEDAAEPVPCVVMAHGFGGTRADAIPAFAERFAGAGLAALVFDYRHFGDSEGEPRQLLDIGLQLEDWTAAIACARTRAGGRRDPHRPVGILVLRRPRRADGRAGWPCAGRDLAGTVRGRAEADGVVPALYEPEDDGARSARPDPGAARPGAALRSGSRTAGLRRGPAVAGLRRRLPRDRGRGVTMAQRVHAARDAARRRVSPVPDGPGAALSVAGLHRGT